MPSTDLCKTAEWENVMLPNSMENVIEIRNNVRINENG